MGVLTQEKAHAINGVSGRMFAATVRDDEAPGAFCSQKWISESRSVKGYHVPALMNVEMRFDDDCRNGHNTFAITATVYHADHRKRRDNMIAGGCMHDEIEKVFPELAPFIKWHLTSSDGPMHYIANTLYHAGDRDYNGLRKGETRPMVTRSGQKMWELVAVNSLGIKTSGTETGLKYTGAETVPLFILEESHVGDEPPATPKLEWRRSMQVGEGKERDLNAARHSAVWPEATDEELMQEPELLKAKLEARHASLMESFKADVTGAGFYWSPEEIAAKA